MIVGGAAIVTGVFLLFFTAVHDHARIHSAATGSRAGAAYGWALRFVAVYERRAMALAVLLFGTGAAGWLVYQTVGRLLVTTSTSGITLSLLSGELLIIYRMFLRVWSFAAQAELQNLREARLG